MINNITNKNINDIDSDSWYFICESDLHFGNWNKIDNDGFALPRKNNVELIKKLHSEYNFDFLICNGDMTSHGSYKNNCFCSSGNEFGAFIKKYYEPLLSYGIPIKLCIGNHDINRLMYPKNALLNFIKNVHDASYDWLYPTKSSCYTFIHKNILFICMGLYPKNLSWLQEVLSNNKFMHSIIFYHYNTKQHELMSWWWSNNIKKKFYNIIKNYNVRLIINGHNHNTYIQLWNGIPNLVCGGEPAIIQIDEILFSSPNISVILTKK